jgi:hypothetical protein
VVPLSGGMSVDVLQTILCRRVVNVTPIEQSYT